MAGLQGIAVAVTKGGRGSSGQPECLMFTLLYDFESNQQIAEIHIVMMQRAVKHRVGTQQDMAPMRTNKLYSLGADPTLQTIALFILEPVQHQRSKVYKLPKVPRVCTCASEHHPPTSVSPCYEESQNFGRMGHASPAWST